MSLELRRNRPFKVQGSRPVLNEVKDLSLRLTDPSKLRMREARTLNLELMIKSLLPARNDQDAPQHRLAVRRHSAGKAAR